MSEVAVRLPAKHTAVTTGVYQIAWRNLWRNRRRTWLTAGGIAFAVFLLVFATSAQFGTFDMMVDNGARLSLGHLQLQHPEYFDDPKLEHSLSDATALVRRLDDQSGVVAVAPRAQAFGLISHGDTTFGGQIVGVVPEREASFTLAASQVRGRYLEGASEAFMGSVLARNLGIELGDEVVMLGTARDGGVAAEVATLVGTFTTGQVAIDRSIMHIPLNDFQLAWGLGDEVSLVAVLADGVGQSLDVVEEVSAPQYRTLSWPELMPEAEQMIELKKVGANVFGGIVAMIVTFSVVNTFMMIVFERRTEFGMLIALGMRATALMRLLALEALWLGCLGVALGLAVSGALVGVLAVQGIPLPVEAADMMVQYNMPDRIYPAFHWGMAITASVLMVVGTQLAGFLPALKIRKLKPVEALRGGD